MDENTSNKFANNKQKYSGKETCAWLRARQSRTRARASSFACSSLMQKNIPDALIEKILLQTFHKDEVFASTFKKKLPRQKFDITCPPSKTMVPVCLEKTKNEWLEGGQEAFRGAEG